ncbi:MAG TPA: RES domain-containing protein [Usitatibacter sp.]|nr:RES domain-containing protein [Usitatibacter sp.]
MNALARVRWARSYRLVPSRFPPVGLFDRVARPEDLEAVFAAEALTNDRLREEAGDIRLVPPAERISGPGTTPVMAPFTHLNPEGSRFSDGTFGVYYAARDLETAIAERAYHAARFLARTRERPGEFDMRTYVAKIDAELVDLRGHGRRRRNDLMAPADYRASQAFARARRDEGAGGIVYDSVRRAEGQCAALFRPRLVRDCRQGTHICLVWDGHTVTGWYEKSGVRNV